MPSPPKRRWFRFRLRTLLIGVALLAVPVGYVAHEWRVVRARKLWLASFRPAGIWSTFTPLENFYRGINPDARPSGIRLWLGDSSVDRFNFWEDDRSEIGAAATLFPEAAIVVWPRIRWSIQLDGDLVQERNSVAQPIRSPLAH